MISRRAPASGEFSSAISTTASRVAGRLEWVEKVSARGDEKFGVQLVANALRDPLRQLADNVGLDGPAIVAEVEEAGGSMGFDGISGKVVDVMKKGIFDPVKVVRVALRNAASIASLNLVSDALIADVPKGEESVPGAVT